MFKTRTFSSQGRSLARLEAPILDLERKNAYEKPVQAFTPPPLEQAAFPALGRAVLHEVYASTEADAPSAAGFTLGLARQIMRGRLLIWVRQDFLDIEAGFINPTGLSEFGLNPAGMIRVRARDAPDALQAGLEAARCAAADVAVIELWGEVRALDLTASRRLSLAAKTSGVTVFLARAAATPQPSAAATRWGVQSALSRALPANAPGNPVFNVRLLRHRGGVAGREWRLEWNRDAGCFEDRTGIQPAARPPGNGSPLSCDLVPLSFGGSGAQGPGEIPGWREAG